MRYLGRMTDVSADQQTLWEIYELSGADTDGDRTPAALIAGMGAAKYASLVVDEVRELRAEHDGRGKSIDGAEQWARQSLRRLDWLLSEGLGTCSTISLRSQVEIVRDEQRAILAVLADPDADERSKP